VSHTPHRGMVAAGHELTAQAGARVLREGGNAVDAALAAMLTSFVAEPLLTGLGSGGYMLVAGAGERPTLLDFFVAAPGRGRGRCPTPPAVAKLLPVEVSFDDAVQVFHVGTSSCGTYGAPAGVCAAAARWGSLPLADLATPAAALARSGVALNAQQAYVARILGQLLLSTPECAGLWAPAGRVLGEGDVLIDGDLGDALQRLGSDGAEPFYRGDLAGAVCGWLEPRGGVITAQDLRDYKAIEREPVRVSYRGADVLTNPPPSAGGTLLAYSLTLLERGPAPPTLPSVVAAMQAAQVQRTDAFLDGLADPGFLESFLASHLGCTTHIAVLDGDGRACSVTTSNGEGSGVIVPHTGIHLNNMMGEQDLNPMGFHRHPPGRRMPSMMAPSVVLDQDRVRLVVGSAGSNRIRSAILQTIVGVVDHGLRAKEAVDAPRVHFEEATVYAEPGIDPVALEQVGHPVAHFRAPNLFFGGVQAIECDPLTGEVSGAGDPRRGGVAVAA